MHDASQVGGPWTPCGVLYASPDCEHESMGLHVAELLPVAILARPALPSEGRREALLRGAAALLLTQFVREGRIKHSLNPRCSELMPTDGDCDCGLTEARYLAAALTSADPSTKP